MVRLSIKGRLEGMEEDKFQKTRGVQEVVVEIHKKGGGNAK